MSPIPSPAPLRRAFLRALFSPGSLLFGFVVLIIITCPGARGEGVMGLLTENEGLFGPDYLTLDMPVAEAEPAPVISPAAKFGRMPSSTARSATPVERGGSPAAGAGPSFRHSRAALPLLVDPLLDDAPRAPSVRISPMTGPTVGIRPKLPAPLR